MAMVVANNPMATTILNETQRNSLNKKNSLAKLASGMKINSAGDDASMYSISEKMRVQIRTLSQDVDNTQTGRSMVAVAEGGIQNIINNLRYLKEKALDAANDHNTDADRAMIQKEVNVRLDEINDIASTTSYNGHFLLNGDYREYKADATAIIDYTFRANELGELTKGFKVITGKEYGSDTMMFEGITGNKSYNDGAMKLEVDFSKVSKPPSGGLTYPDSFNKQGFCMGCGACNAYINVTFDATKSANDSVVYIDDTGERAGGPHSSSQINWSYAYVIGIKDATDSASLAKAFYDGVIAANDKEDSCPEGWDVTENRGSEGIFGQVWGWTHNTRITYDGSKVYLERDSSPPWVFYDTGAFQVNANNAAGLGFDKPKLIIHTGTKASQNIRLFIEDMHTSAMKIDPLEVGTREKAEMAINAVDKAIEYALNANTRMGAYQARLLETEDNLVIASENTTAAESVIRDADMAQTMMVYTKNNILQQSSQAMLAQANQLPTNVLNLLQ